MSQNRTAKQRRTLGLIGVGLLGSALAERFLAAGWEVVGYDKEASRRDRLRELGGRPATSVAQAVQGCSRLVLCLPTSSVSAEVLDAVRPLLRPGLIVVDTTTGDPEEMAAIGESLGRVGVRYLDATVGGSSKQVRADENNRFAGGDPSAYQACTDLFASFARRAFHAGPCGYGAQMKLVATLVLGLNRAVLAEGLAFAAACGLDPATTLEILKEGPAYSKAMDIKGRKMLTGDFTPEARLAQHLKDVRLILASGARCGARLPFSELHRALLEELEKAGYGGDDNSAIIRAFQTRAGAKEGS